MLRVLQGQLIRKPGGSLVEDHSNIDPPHYRPVIKIAILQAITGPTVQPWQGRRPTQPTEGAERGVRRPSEQSHSSR